MKTATGSNIVAVIAKRYTIAYIKAKIFIVSKIFKMMGM